MFQVPWIIIEWCQLINHIIAQPLSISCCFFFSFSESISNWVWEIPHLQLMIVLSSSQAFSVHYTCGVWWNTINMGLTIDIILWVWGRWWMMVRDLSFLKVLLVLIWNPDFPPKTTIMKIIDLWSFLLGGVLVGWKTFLHI